MNQYEPSDDTVDAAGKQNLLQEIKKQAEEEAEQKIADAEKTAQQKLESTKGRIERIKRDAEERAQKRIKQIEDNNESAIKILKKRLQLRRQEEIVRMVLNKVRERCKALIDTPEYSRYVKQWIAEAAIGLDQDEAVVFVSDAEKDLLTDDLIAEAERMVEDTVGKGISLQTSSNTLSRQGVVVRSKDGRLEYNNQIETKLYRNQAEIRRKIYRTLYDRGAE
jgi:vacuolar-type H+-ATPase subunit E/Vma4